jgi:hypothetical protein
MSKYVSIKQDICPICPKVSIVNIIANFLRIYLIG